MTNLALPPTAVSDISSSTTQALVSFAGPAELIGGLLVAFLIFELVVHVLLPGARQPLTEEM
jgi:hypothetical protein